MNEVKFDTQYSFVDQHNDHRSILCRNIYLNAIYHLHPRLNLAMYLFFPLLTQSPSTLFHPFQSLSQVKK
jgi:hypothetical protein